MNWKWVQIVVLKERGYFAPQGVSLLRQARGLKEAIKGLCNGISNVSLPLKTVRKTSALHFSLPCYSFVFQTIWESALVSLHSYFFQNKVISQASSSACYSEIRIVFPNAKPEARLQWSHLAVTVQTLYTGLVGIIILSTFSTQFSPTVKRCDFAFRPTAYQHSWAARCSFSASLCQKSDLKRVVFTPRSHNGGWCRVNTLIVLWLPSPHPLEGHCILLPWASGKLKPCSNLFSANPLINHSLLH